MPDDQTETIARTCAGSEALRVIQKHGVEVGTEILRGYFNAFTRALVAVDGTPDEGKRAGLAGDPRKPPHDPSVPQHQSWLKGYADGNEVLARGIGPIRRAAAKGNEDEPQEDFEDAMDATGDAMPEPASTAAH